MPKQIKDDIGYILVVDDTLQNVELIKWIIKERLPEYQVLTASSGKEAMSLLREYSPDIILLDVIMPDEDGFTVCEKIKSDPSLCHIPIILISALGKGSSFRVRGLKSGADGFLEKPFDHDEFVAILNVMIRMRKAEDELRDRNHHLRLSLDDYENHQRKLKSLNAELTKAEEVEQKRIADLLHDGIAQYLSLANIKLSSLYSSVDNSKVKAVIKESMELVSRSIKETRELIYELNLPILKELGLISALNWKKVEWMKLFKLNILIRSQLNEQNLSLDNKVVVFRIISELVNNVYKHAKASKVSILVKDDGEMVECMVTDNGMGFNRDVSTSFTQQSGYGLFRIKERLELIMGTINVESKTGKGTRIKFRIPKA